MPVRYSRLLNRLLRNWFGDRWGLARYDEDSPEEAKSMTFVSDETTTIIRTERGLTIAGTRITIYDVMDYLKAQYPPKLIREKLGLSDGQLDLALDYIEQHRSAVEIEYQECLQTATEIREYWEERNRERFAQITAMPPKPGQEALRAKLQEWKDRIETQS